VNLNTITNNDALSYLRELPDESIDLVLTDPAYESLMKWQGVGTTARMGFGKAGSRSDDDSKFFDVFPNADIPDLMQEFYRVLKPGCHCYVFCDWETLKIIHTAAIAEGVFPPQKISGVVCEPFKPLIWDKVAPGMGYTYRCQYEFIAFLWKGKKKKLNNLGISDVLRVKRVAPSQADVPTQKPIELMLLLIEQSTQPNDVVLDVFMGNGTMARAAKSLDRRWLGCDIDANRVERVNNEIAELLGI
jgi:site-specific DNA-methyltransferase (adenine-specific)